MLGEEVERIHRRFVGTLKELTDNPGFNRGNTLELYAKLVDVLPQEHRDILKTVTDTPDTGPVWLDWFFKKCLDEAGLQVISPVLDRNSQGDTLGIVVRK
ncbi:hypothetical protein [Archangium violaceum]|uniref:hypothetical protein n=1 Tax=Archangium violaceum TaxID=83451 RepID=UPI0013628C27|nr:hypothetical protein [Archangium violaceum]